MIDDSSCSQRNGFGAFPTPSCTCTTVTISHDTMERASVTDLQVADSITSYHMKLWFGAVCPKKFYDVQQKVSYGKTACY